MKKIASFLLSSLALCSLLSACGGSASKSASVPSSKTESNASASPSISSAKESATMSKKSVKIYTPLSTETISLELSISTLYPDIWFIDLDSIASLLAQIKGLDPSMFSLSMLDTQGTITSESGAKVLFDFAKKTIAFDDRELFFALSDFKSCLDPLGVFQENPAGSTYYIEREPGKQIGKGHPVSIDLLSHEIPMILEGGKGYIPSATFSDLFLNSFGVRFIHNGVDGFLVFGEMNAEMKAAYYAVGPGERSASLAEFTYHELCLNGDYVYALKGKHDITSFDDFFTRNHRKEDLLSTDAATAAKALAYVTYFDLDDNHSAMGAASYLAGSTLNLASKAYHGTSQRAWDENYALFSAARKDKLGTFLPYQEIGDTAFVSFDVFASYSKDYYQSFPTLEDAGKDTFALVEYAHQQITKTGSAIKKVVIDLSCNSGGAASAAGYIASWYLDGATFHIANPLDGATLSLPLKADINLDGRFDSSDSLTGRGLKLFCLTSPLSFSCGNLVPSLFKNGTTNRVTLIGQKTGGGACVVDNTSTADGTLFAFSGTAMMCTVKNGVFYDVDQGIEPEVTLSQVSSFYDRPSLVTYLDTIK